MKRQRAFFKLIWWGYLLLLLTFVIIKFRGSFEELADRISCAPFGTYNLIPFATTGEFFAHFSEGWARYNIYGNVIPFVPFGVFLPLAFQKANSWRRVLGIGFLSVLLIELFQFFTRLGTFDVDDIILNMIGIVCGHFILRFARRFSRKDRKT